MKNQIPLSFPLRESHSAEDFMPAPCNQSALDWIGRFPDWPSPLVIFCGDHGAGKTHLLHLWAEKTDAKIISLNSSHGSESTEAFHKLEYSNKNLTIDDTHLGFGDEGFERILFHLYNQAKENLTYILLSMSNNSGRNGDSESCSVENILETVQLPDLKSRLRAAPLVMIDQPDDMALQAVLVKLFHDRQLKVEPGVINYILPRIERSFAAARALVARIDENSLAEKRSVTVPLVRELL